MLLQVRQHDDERNLFLVHHSPEVLNRGVEGALRGDKKLVVARHGRVDEVRIDVGIVDVLIALNQTYARVLNYAHQMRSDALSNLTYRVSARHTGLVNPPCAFR